MVCLTDKAVLSFTNLNVSAKISMWDQINLPLETRLGRHVLTLISQGGVSESIHLTQSVCESAIGLRLLKKPGCVLKYTDEVFRILHKDS